jgi:hypothetical protein
MDAVIPEILVRHDESAVLTAAMLAKLDEEAIEDATRRQAEHPPCRR